MAPRVALLILALAATAHAETRPPLGGRAVASLPSAPGTFDPIEARSAADVLLAGLVFDGLYRFDATGRVVPQLAETLPAVSADGLEARIPLRVGARFHDGRPVRPADVSASLRRAQSAPQTDWALASVITIAHVEDAVVLKLRRPDPELASHLALPQLAVTPLGRPPAPRAPIGSGPFRVRRVADAARRLELDASVDCFAGRPYLDGITLRWFEDADDEARAYEAGEADVSLRGAVAFSGHQPKFATTDFQGPATVMTYLAFGRARGDALADPELRAAISLAIGRAAFRHIGSGERVVPSASPVPPDLIGVVAPLPAPPLAGAQPAPPGELAAQPDRARAALARAAARHGKLARLEILVDRSRPEDVDVATRVVAALDAIGVSAGYTVLAAADLERRMTAGLYDLAIGQLAAASPDPVAAIAAAFAAGGDRWAQARLAQGALGLDAAAAAFAERLPVLPLFHRALRAHHKVTLRGLGGDTLGRLDFADAYVWTGPADPVGQAP